MDGKLMRIFLVRPAIEADGGVWLWLDKRAAYTDSHLAFPTHQAVLITDQPATTWAIHARCWILERELQHLIRICKVEFLQCGVKYLVYIVV